MKDAVRFGTTLALGWALAGCTTTGDPRQGGLFGWSEAKARDRQNERLARVEAAQTELANTEARSRNLEARNARTEEQLSTARLANGRAEEKLRAQQTALLAKVDRLEAESPTSAGASRARSYRVKINTIAAQTALSTAERSGRLRGIEADVDAALEKARR